MASIRRRTTKAGAEFYEIRVRVSRDRPELSTRWYAPDGWSQKAIDREVAKVAAEFERQCKAGEVLSRNEYKAQTAQKALERAKIKKLKHTSNRYSCRRRPLPPPHARLQAINGHLRNTCSRCWVIFS